MAAQQASTSRGTGQKTDTEPTYLDICIISGEFERLTELDAFFRSLGHRTTLTSHARMPDGHEWESYDLVLVDPQRYGMYPQLPVKMIHHLVCLCNNSETNDPATLRSTLEKLRDCLRDLTPEITIDEELRQAALRPIEAMFRVTEGGVPVSSGT